MKIFDFVTSLKVDIFYYYNSTIFLLYQPKPVHRVKTSKLKEIKTITTSITAG